jgi:tRNA (mo5U34)-methyltransferase
MTPIELQEMREICWWHRIPLGKDPLGKTIYTPGEARHGDDEEDYASNRFGLPLDLKGQRVADIGGWDGYFSFEAEKRGALVTNFDVGRREGGNWGNVKGFDFAKKILKSGVIYSNTSIYDLTPEKVEPFDITFFFGVLYHLKSPLIALERLFSVTKEGGYSLIETAYDTQTDEEKPTWSFLHGYHGDPTNYFFPNMNALMTALFYVGFKEVKTIYDKEERCTLKALR